MMSQPVSDRLVVHLCVWSKLEPIYVVLTCKTATENRQGRVRWGRRGRVPYPRALKRKKKAWVQYVVVWRVFHATAPLTPRPVMHGTSGRELFVCGSTVDLKGVGISVCCLKSNFTANVPFRRAAASRGSGFTRIMVSRAPNRRADDQHSLSSFFWAKVSDNGRGGRIVFDL